MDYEDDDQHLAAEDSLHISQDDDDEEEIPMTSQQVCTNLPTLTARIWMKNG